MPSDARIEKISNAMSASGEPFRNAVANTVQTVKALLATHEDSREDVADYSRAELGNFAAGRIDLDRFTSVVTSRGEIAPPMLAVIERCLTVLEVFEQMVNNVVTVSAKPGQRVSEVVAEALFQVGLAFGAARALDLARNGEHVESKHGALLDGLPFAQWTKAERQLAPPIIVEADGAAMDCASLAAFMDGSVKIVVLPRSVCAPAPLVRLVTPRTMVVQTRNPDALAPVATWKGSGVALVADDIARFTHLPEGGRTLQARLTVEGYPPNPRHAIEGISVSQQLEELEQLRTLAGLVGSSDTAAGEEETDTSALPPDPADKLAAWLLNQAHGLEV